MRSIHPSARSSQSSQSSRVHPVEVEPHANFREDDPLVVRVEPERDGDAGGEAAEQHFVRRRPLVGPAGAESLVATPRELAGPNGDLGPFLEYGGYERYLLLRPRVAVRASATDQAGPDFFTIPSFFMRERSVLGWQRFRHLLFGRSGNR